MAQEEIAEGEILIAEFDGWIKDGDKYWHKDRNITAYHDPKDFQYHSSWDWLMPVVEKIGKISTFHTQSHPNGEVYVSVHVDEKYYQSGKGKYIEQHYIAVVEFIKWYNTQSK